MQLWLIATNGARTQALLNATVVCSTSCSNSPNFVFWRRNRKISKDETDEVAAVALKRVDSVILHHHLPWTTNHEQKYKRIQIQIVKSTSCWKVIFCSSRSQNERNVIFVEREDGQWCHDICCWCISTLSHGWEESYSSVTWRHSFVPLLKKLATWWSFYSIDFKLRGI